LEKSAKDKIAEAEKIILQAKQKEEAADELADKLQDKLDAVGIREADLLTKAQKLDAREILVQSSEANLAESEKKLKIAIQDFADKATKRDADIVARETAVVLRERSAESRDASLVRKDKELDKERIYIIDQRKTLERGFEELRRREAKIPQDVQPTGGSIKA
jgi:hypothetical protein